MNMAIEAINLHYRTPRGRSLLRTVNLRANYGEICAIVGPNGSGKSTLLRLLSGELAPSIGAIALANRPLASYKSLELAQKRAVLSQKNELALPFRAEDVVLMGRYPFFDHKPRVEDHKAVQVAMEQVGVADLRHRFYATLSGGEQQRVQIARVLAQVHHHESAILLLDEPLNNLDLRYQHLLLDTAKAHAARGCCIVMVMHDLNLAARYADQALLLHEGQVLATGRPDLVLIPRHLRTAYHVETEWVRHPASGHPFIVSTAIASPFITI